MCLQFGGQFKAVLEGNAETNKQKPEPNDVIFGMLKNVQLLAGKIIVMSCTKF